jgi:hypothetical protein
VEVEPLVLPTSADVEVGKKPTAVADADTASRWGRGGWYTIGYMEGALLDEAATPFLFLLSLCAQIVSSTMIALLTNSRKVPPVLSARCSYSLVESPFIK